MIEDATSSGVLNVTKHDAGTWHLTADNTYLGSTTVNGGELVLTTPCTWLEEFTPPGNWPSEGTFAWLKSELEGDFELLAEHDEPFLIRETARKFQWTVSQVSKWRRR